MPFEKGKLERSTLYSRHGEVSDFTKSGGPSMTMSVRRQTNGQPRSRLSVDLGALKSKWKSWCTQRGVTPSEALRKLVVEAVAVAADRPNLPQSLPARSGPCVRIQIGLTQAELDGVRGVAYVNGFTANRWIVALVRAQLTREPQLGNREMTLLAESNRQLATIRTLLGELARGPNCSELPEGFDWEHTRALIDTHLRTVTTLLRSNLDRWSR